MKPKYSNYKICIRNNETGETRIREMGVSWHEHSLYWLTGGNFGCDCNREWEFQRANGEKTTEDPACGNEKYSILWAKFPDGTVMEID